MRINTTRAGKILGGVSKAVVRKLVEHGKLNDYGATKPGGYRHEFVLESAEDKAFAAAHVRQGRQWIPVATNSQATVKRTYTRKPKVTTAPATAPAIPDNGKITTGSGEGLLARLDRIEKFLFG